MKAVWNNQVLAEADDKDIIEIEGNSYFPPETLTSDSFEKTDTHTVCPWKGEASYYDIVVNGERNEQAAWYYPEPKAGSEETVGRKFANYVAFWNGVEVT